MQPGQSVGCTMGCHMSDCLIPLFERSKQNRGVDPANSSNAVENCVTCGKYRGTCGTDYELPIENHCWFLNVVKYDRRVETFTQQPAAGLAVSILGGYVCKGMLIVCLW